LLSDFLARFLGRFLGLGKQSTHKISLSGFTYAGTGAASTTASTTTASTAATGAPQQLAWTTSYTGSDGTVYTGNNGFTVSSSKSAIGADDDTLTYMLSSD
jgi:hypothetical protein